MTILIVGGLLIIGVVALVALFFVARSEPAVRNTRHATVTPQRAIPASQEVPAQPVVREPQPEQDVRPEPVRTVPSQESPLAVQDMGIQPSSEEDEQPIRVRLNGQFHELADGLRVLQRQTTEMEQRLNSLTQMLDSIEESSHDER